MAHDRAFLLGLAIFRRSTSGFVVEWSFFQPEESLYRRPVLRATELIYLIAKAESTYAKSSNYYSGAGTRASRARQ
jgi:hypothetical protein